MREPAAAPTPSEASVTPNEGGQRRLVDAGLAYRRTPAAYNFGLPLFAGYQNLTGLPS